MQTALTYRTNRDLFSNYYLDEHLPETEAWDALSDDELREARADIMDLWEREKDTASKRNESQLEEKFIRPMFRKLDIPFEVEESTSRTQRRPDYGFFDTEDAARDAFERREEGGNFYENSVAVADAKRWGRSLDTRGSGEHDRDFENPSYQIHVYLQETPTRWAVLTNGQKWRLYYGPTSHRLDSYYEVDLPTILEKGDLKDFKYFYFFFRHEAFVTEADGDCFLDDVFEESTVFAQELGEDLQDNIYEAIKILAEGFLQYPDNDLTEDDLELIHDSALIYLYRLIFVLYAEAEGRGLLDTDNEIYRDSYSLNTLKQDVAEELDSANPKYREWQDNLWSQLDELFKLIDRGSRSREIPKDDLYIPAYNGGLFRTDPDEFDSPEARFLANHPVGDAYLAEVIELLTRSANGNGGGKIFVDYSSLDIRHLGSVYEGLLEYQLHVADEPLVLKAGGYVSADGEGEIDDEVLVAEGEVYLTTESGERKATGSYYTPEYVVEYIVENTLGPLVEEIRKDLAGRSARHEGGFAEEFAEEIFQLKVLDPAMGSGHFLTSAVDYLAREIIDAQERQAAQKGIETVDEDHDINWARRQVAQRCIYGVDLNPLAVELAKVSLWLRTLAAEQPLAFLDHHLKTGNSLLGSDIEDVLENGNGNDVTDDQQLTLQDSFDHTRRRALEHVTDRFQELLAIDNQTLDDVKEMESVFEEVREDPLYRHLLAMANVHTADSFGLDVPDEAYERMAAALRDDSWAKIESHDWFRAAQAMAGEESFFHWELEFPVAFYGEDGFRETGAGFDVIIGNPPYIPTEELPENVRKYLVAQFPEVLHRKYDSSVAFLQQSFEHSVEGKGLVGMITPVSWETGNNYEPFRSENFGKSGDVGIQQVINLPFDVFPDAYIDTTICIFTPGQIPGEFAVKDFPKRYQIHDASEIGRDLDTIDYKHLFDDPATKIYVLESIYDLMAKYGSDDYRTIGEVTDSTQGPVESHYEYSKTRKADSQLLYRNLDVYRYSLSVTEERYIHIESDDPDRYYYTTPRVLIRRLVNRDDRLMAMYETEDYVVKKDLNPFIRDGATESLQYLLANLNSALYSYLYINQSSLALKDDFRQTTLTDLRELPYRGLNVESDAYRDPKLSEEAVGLIDAAVIEGSESAIAKLLETVRMNLNDDDEFVHDVIISIVERIIDTKALYGEINTDILAYFGEDLRQDNLESPEDYTRLADLDEYQPPTEKSNLLTEKTNEEGFETIQVTGARIQKEDLKLELRVDIRTRRDSDDEFDHNEGITAATFLRPDEELAILLSAFLPEAIDIAQGYAEFRNYATSSQSSLEDRLKEIRLPHTSEVSGDVERFLERKEEASRLSERIRRCDDILDRIVYQLYDLSQEQINQVEERLKS